MAEVFTEDQKICMGREHWSEKNLVVGEPEIKKKKKYKNYILSYCSSQKRHHTYFSVRIFPKIPTVLLCFVCFTVQIYINNLVYKE